MKIGILKENKIPNDTRVPLTPEQCKVIKDTTGYDVFIQTSDTRCFADERYKSFGLEVVEDLSHCDLLMGVKEVPIEDLIPNRTYMFFSHTIKKQPYNRKLLQAILVNRIRLIDYETLVNDSNKRVIAFGKFAGMVGAHNGVMTFGSRTGLFSLPRMTTFREYRDAKVYYENMDWAPMKIVLTGTGRVGNGAVEVLKDMGINQCSASEFLSSDELSGPIFTQLSSSDYIRHKDSGKFDRKDFYQNPKNYRAEFGPFYKTADVFINGIYWNNDAPVFFTREDMLSDDFTIQVIADITCDIAPEASVPSTLRASTIDEPVYGYDPKTGQEEDAFQPDCIDVMAIDNLPNEMPRDASRAFGNMFVKYVLPELGNSSSRMIENAAITTNDGKLSEKFQYLSEYVAK